MSLVNLSNTTLINNVSFNCPLTLVQGFSMLSNSNLKTCDKNKKTLKTTSLLSDKKKISSTSKSTKSTNSLKNSITKKSSLTKKSSKTMSTKSDKDEKIVSINFEVFGKVQGWYFYLFIYLFKTIKYIELKISILNQIWNLNYLKKIRINYK